MPHADPQERSAYLRLWRQKNFVKTRGYYEARRKRLSEKDREYQKIYREKHREKARQNTRKHRQLHLEEVRGRDRLRNKSEGRKKWARSYKLIYALRRYHSEPEFKILHNLRARMRAALRGKNKSDRTLKLLGCSAADWRSHLERQFRPGMTWENYGPVWHVDHIQPCASFDLTDPAQQRACFNWSNTQPLFVEENLRKGDQLHGGGHEGIQNSSLAG